MKPSNLKYRHEVCQVVYGQDIYNALDTLYDPLGNDYVYMR